MPDRDLSSIDFQIGGIGIRLRYQRIQNIDALIYRLAGFGSRSHPDLVVTAEAAQTPSVNSLLEIPVVFSQNRATINGSGIQGEIDPDHGCARLSLSLNNYAIQVEYFLRVAAAILVFRSGGLMIHAAGIKSGKDAFLFFGHSGSGKTTVAGFSSRQQVLNDDLVVIMPEQTSWRVHATPFWNPSQIVPVNSNGLLRAMYRLVQDRDVFLEPMRNAQSLAEIIANIPVIPANPLWIGPLLERCQSLIREVPVNKIHFRRDSTFWDLIG